MKKRLMLLMMCLLVAIFAFGCNSGLMVYDDNGGGTMEETPSEPNTDDTENTIQGYDIEDSNTDLYQDYSDAIIITLKDNASNVANNNGQDISGVSIDNNIISITKTGSYEFSGTLTNGQIYVNVAGNVYLCLNGVDITSTESAPIVIMGSKKKIITLASGSENTLTDSTSYTKFYNTDNDEPNGALFSKKSLTINGTGKLTVNANYNNGISCKGSLKIIGDIENNIDSNITVVAKNNAIKGNDAVIIKNSKVKINSTGDSIKSDNEEDGTGYMYFEDCDIEINSSEDGLQAFNSLQIKSGVFNIVCGGGYNVITGRDDTTSYKAIKSDKYILINDGSFTINSKDDAIHCNDTLLIKGGEFNINTGDDAFHADKILTIDDGKITIANSYEGIESAKITINGGEIYVNSSDDGINAADGTDNKPNQANYNCAMIINGGNITVNASGDGVDSNGTILITGGKLVIYGPTSNNNGALDSDGGIKVNGGVVVAVGSSGMVEAPTTDSLQKSVSILLSSSKSGLGQLVLKNSSGEELLKIIPEKAFQSIVISTADFTLNNSYTVEYNNSQIASFTVTSTLTQVGYSSGGSGGFRPR